MSPFRLPLAALAALMSTVTPALADSHVRIQAYDRDTVVVAPCAADRELMIEFAPGEHIENVAVGDASHWQVTPNRRAELLFVKALYTTGRSNMTVVTDRRRYLFDLVATPVTARAPVYDLRFAYKDEPPVTATVTVTEPPAPAPPGPAAAAQPDPSVAPRPRNVRYSFTGSAKIVPRRIYDDGQSTYFHWAATDAPPAITAIDANGRQEMVNPSVRGDNIVIDLVARSFILKSGGQMARLYNDSFTPETPDQDAPRPRAEHPQARGLFGGLGQKGTTDGR
jgi:type IV secretion system protein VirB9